MKSKLKQGKSRKDILDHSKMFEWRRREIDGNSFSNIVEVKCRKKIGDKSGKREVNMADYLDEATRSEAIMDSLTFQDSILITDEGNLVIVGRVVVPEHASMPALSKDLIGTEIEMS